MERQIRLRRSADIARVRQEGRSWAHPLLVLAACPNGLPYTRIGVVASRKLGQAAARNRAKRLLREGARHLYPHLKAGRDLLLIARPGILEEKEFKVREALIHVARRADLLEESAEP